MYYDKCIKVCIVGDTGNGKTSLINKFVNDEFCYDVSSTIGVDFKCKSIDINEQKIKIKIWDTAGQEKFGDIVKIFYRDSDGVILTYDMTNRESFLNLEKWLEKINNVVDEKYSCIILVGTKNDLMNKIKVFESDIDNFINKHKLKHFKVSSINNENIDLLFMTISEMIIEKTKNKPEKKKHIIADNNYIKYEDNTPKVSSWWSSYCTIQ